MPANQRLYIVIIAEFTYEDVNSIPIGTDGCGAPIYLMPINKIAQSYARLVRHCLGIKEGSLGV